MPSSESADWFDGLCRGLRESNADVALRYEQREAIGRGGMSVVYRAWDRELKRPVALKVLRDDSLMSDVVRKRLEREARVTAGLAHPNIVTLYDVLESDDGFCLVMELVDGAPLSRVLGERKFETTEMLRLLQKVAEGVAAAHAKEIVHRDLKPANILLTAAGEPKVADFGLAHIAGSETLLTRTGEAVGTPAYMAPEQVRGDTARITPRTDVYALGAILYEVAAGRPPHVGETMAGIFQRILHDDPLPLRKINRKIPRDLETIVMKSLEKEPLRRYPSAAELAEDLRRFLDGESIRARPPSLPAKIVKWAGRHRAATAASGVASIGLLVAAVVFAVRTIRESRRRAEITGAVAAAQAAGDWRGAARLLTTLENLGDPTAGRKAEEAARRAKELEDRKRADELVREARSNEAEFDALQKRLGGDLAAAIREEEGRLNPWEPIEKRERLLGLRREHEDGRRKLLSLEARITSLYSSALQYRPRDAAVANGWVEFQWKRMEEAEAAGDADRAMSLEESIRQSAMRCDLREILDRLEGGGGLSIDSSPSGAEVHLFRYEEGRDGRLMPRPYRASDGSTRTPEREATPETAYELEFSDFNLAGRSPLKRIDVRLGSYLIVTREARYAEARSPVRVFTRGRTWTASVKLHTREEVGAGFVHVPGGPFQTRAERTVVSVDDFFIARFEVTCDEYREFVEDLAIRDAGQAKARMPRQQAGSLWVMSPEGKVRYLAEGMGRWPVVGISAYDAAEYCAWRTRRAQERGERVSYRLPSVFEWEKAAGGVDGRAYPWGDRFDYAFTKGGYSREGKAEPEPVGTFPADESPYGVRDMAGSVSEWSQNWFSDDRRSVITCGGAWGSATEQSFQTTYRSHNSPDGFHQGTGVRLVRVLEK